MKHLIFLSLIILTLSCKRVSQPIIPVDLKLYEKKLSSGKALTQEDANKIMSDLWDEIKKNTVGRELPSVQLENLHGNIVDINDIVNKRSIIIISDSHCGFGGATLTKDFPVELMKLKKNHKDFDVFCIVVKTKSDLSDTADFNSFMAELKPIYPKLYIITETKSKKLNIIGSPTHLLVDKNKIVVSYQTGMAMQPNLLYNELNNFLINYK